MEEDEVFLKYLIDEEIYIIEDKNMPSANTEIDTVADKNIPHASNEVDNAADKNTSNSSAGKSKPVSVVKIQTKVEVDGNNSANGISTVDVNDTVSVDKTDDGINSGKEKRANEYRNSTVLLVDYDNRSLMLPNHENLLSKVLNSVNLDLNSVDLVFKAEFDKLSPESFIDCYVITFLPAVPKHLNTLFTEEKYIINVIQGSQFLSCDTLHHLNGEKLLKRKLWEQLKLIYGI